MFRFRLVFFGYLYGVLRLEGFFGESLFFFIVGESYCEVCCSRVFSGLWGFVYGDGEVSGVVGGSFVDIW